MKIGGRIQRLLSDPASTDLAQLWVLTPHATKVRYQLLNPSTGLVMESDYRDANEAVTLLRIVDGELHYQSIKWQPSSVPIHPIDWEHQLALYKQQLLIKLISE